MDSYEFKKLIVEFNEDLEEIGERLYLVLDGDILGDDGADAIRAAQNKIKKYDALLDSLEEPFREKFKERYSEDMELDRERVNEIKKR